MRQEFVLSAVGGWTSPAVHVSVASLHAGIRWPLSIYVSVT